MTQIELLGTVTYVYVCVECNNLQRFAPNGRCEICRSYNIQSLQRIIEEYTVDMAHLKFSARKVALEKGYRLWKQHETIYYI
mgnify:CR=1 FL=1